MKISRGKFFKNWFNLGLKTALRIEANISDEEKPDKTVDCNSVLYRILTSQNAKSRDLIFKIASYSSSFSLSRVFINQDDAKAVL